jgi:hypothetical protein
MHKLKTRGASNPSTKEMRPHCGEAMIVGVKKERHGTRDNTQSVGVPKKKRKKKTLREKKNIKIGRKEMVKLMPFLCTGDRRRPRKTLCHCQGGNRQDTATPDLRVSLAHTQTHTDASGAFQAIRAMEANSSTYERAVRSLQFPRNDIDRAIFPRA